MPRIDHKKLAEVQRCLAPAFYALMAVALLAALAGAPQLAFLLLIAGGCVHTGRVGLEEVLTTPTRRSSGVNRRG